VSRPVDHVIWDWNGTLYDDADVVVAAVNDVLANHGRPPIDADYYRTHYQRPVRSFYERLLGTALTDDDWQAVDDVFHVGYGGRLADVVLTAGAEEALRRVADISCTQSVLSMWRHDDLLRVVSELGVDGYFVHVDGLEGQPGGSKSEKLPDHLHTLAETVGVEPDSIVMIGDALDDAAAADATGIRCVLFDSGSSHHRHALEAAGVPVADSLLHAVDIALGAKV
jgi:phosphoglycolate phosphatase-like HAD superfamily hydrolase